MNQMASQAAGLVAELVRSAEWDTIVDKQLAPGESMSIQAAAGAGKTTVLAERARMRPGQQHLGTVQPSHTFPHPTHSHILPPCIPTSPHPLAPAHPRTSVPDSTLRSA